MDTEIIEKWIKDSDECARKWKRLSVFEAFLALALVFLSGIYLGLIIQGKLNLWYIAFVLFWVAMSLNVAYSCRKTSKRCAKWKAHGDLLRQVRKECEKQMTNSREIMLFDQLMASLNDI